MPLWPFGPEILSSIADIEVFVSCDLSFQAFQKYEKVEMGACTQSKNSRGDVGTNSRIPGVFGWFGMSAEISG